MRIISEITAKSKRKKRIRRKLNYAVVAGLVALAMSVGLYLAFQLNSVQRKIVYPYPYQEIIKRYATSYGVDSNLAAAVIKTESKFERTARSHRGALGLMQIMPDTGDWIAAQLDEDDFKDELLREPETNIRYGIWYLSVLIGEFHGNEVLALAAYNAGLGNVRSWMDKYGWDTDFAAIDEIPFGETREYVHRVLKHKQRYKELYH